MEIKQTRANANKLVRKIKEEYFELKQNDNIVSWEDYESYIANNGFPPIEGEERITAEADVFGWMQSKLPTAQEKVTKEEQAQGVQRTRCDIDLEEVREQKGRIEQTSGQLKADLATANAAKEAAEGAKADCDGALATANAAKEAANAAKEAAEAAKEAAEAAKSQCDDDLVTAQQAAGQKSQLEFNKVDLLELEDVCGEDGVEYATCKYELSGVMLQKLKSTEDDTLFAKVAELEFCYAKGDCKTQLIGEVCGEEESSSCDDINFE